MKDCKYCNSFVEKLDTWFLKDIENFTERSLKIGVCTNCHKQFVELIEKRISDNKIFNNQQSGKKAEKIAKNEKKRIKYTLREAHSSSSHWVYGVNTEIRNKKGVVTQTNQFSYDLKTNKSMGKIKSVRV